MTFIIRSETGTHLGSLPSESTYTSFRNGIEQPNHDNILSPLNLSDGSLANMETTSLAPFSWDRERYESVEF